MGQYAGADHESQQMDDNDKGGADAEGDEPASRDFFVKLHLHQGYLQPSVHIIVSQLKTQSSIHLA